MRRVAFLLTAAVMLAACDPATAPRSLQSSVDDSRLPAELRAAYLEDANRLALRDLLANGFSEVPIPEDAVQPYYNALVLVYNATALPARDTVVDVYRIHTFPAPTTRSLTLQLRASDAWVQALARREIPTGDPTVDTLLARYALSVGSVFTLSNGDVFLTLGSARPLNVKALGTLFVGIAGVKSAEPNGAIGDGADIVGSLSSAVLLTYSVGYGDCPAGCIARRFYHFAVHDDGTVEYLGASGAPPPQPGQP